MNYDVFFFKYWIQIQLGEEGELLEACLWMGGRTVGFSVSLVYCLALGILLLLENWALMVPGAFSAQRFGNHGVKLDKIGHFLPCLASMRYNKMCQTQPSQTFPDKSIYFVLKDFSMHLAHLIPTGPSPTKSVNRQTSCSYETLIDGFRIFWKGRSGLGIYIELKPKCNWCNTSLASLRQCRP